MGIIKWYRTKDEYGKIRFWRTFWKRFVLILLLAISITGFILCCIGLHNLCLNEFNAQIDKFGFYKSDIKILNQRNEEIGLTIALVVSIVTFFVEITVTLFEFLDN